MPKDRKSRPPRVKMVEGVLNGRGYYYAFLAGAKRILENQRELNRINVFPVPDADTGSNLASTVRTIIERVRPDHSYKTTSAAIASAALEGARGNSGVIFAQFLYGIGAESGDRHEVSIGHFAQSVLKAVRYMYEAIAEPVEGTMITVIRRWAESMASDKAEAGSFLRLLTHSYGRALEALQETRHRLEAMRRANVVDAGSKAMVLFLEGMIDFLAKPSHKKIVSVKQDAVPIAHVEEVGSDAVRYRYCVEALIKPVPGQAGSGLDREELKRRVAAFGNSLVVAGSRDTLRLHIHTDTPQDMFFKIRDFGCFVRQKADDMRRQYEVAHRRKWDIALVTDSSCDLAPGLLDEYQISMVPIQLDFGDSHYLDKVTITPDQFYAMLDERREFPRTAQPSVRTFEDLYSRLAAHYGSVISVHLSQKLSGTYSASVKAAAEVSRETGKRISVIDSRTLSGALGLLVLRLARSIEQGRSHDEVVAEAERTLPKAKILVAVRTLKSMVRGGRVSPMAGVAAKLVNLKPLVSMAESGESRVFDKAFTQRRSLKNILRRLGEYAAERRISEYAVLHAHNPKDTQAFSLEVEKVLGKRPAYAMDISPVVGLNAGAGALAVSFLVEE